MSTFRGSLSGVTISMAMAAAPALAQHRTVSIMIPALPMAKALQHLAAMTGANILFDPNSFGGSMSRSVKAATNPEQAVRQMVAGTGLTVRRDAQGTLLVTMLEPAVATAPIRPAADKMPGTPSIRYAALQVDESAAQPMPVAPVGSTDADPATTSAAIPDIVVTAQRRSQNLQQVPISITALTAEDLDANRIRNVRDLNAIAPNLTVRTASGGFSVPSYSMRGIVSLSSAPGADKGISLYIDGVYIGASLGSIIDLADIERIEVLKGPQGTLFGRNSTGGAISIITRDPSGKLDVRQELTYGNYDQFRSKTRIDLPSFGPLRARLRRIPKAALV